MRKLFNQNFSYLLASFTSTIFYIFKGPLLGRHKVVFFYQIWFIAVLKQFKLNTFFFFFDGDCCD